VGQTTTPLAVVAVALVAQDQMQALLLAAMAARELQTAFLAPLFFMLAVAVVAQKRALVVLVAPALAVMVRSEQERRQPQERQTVVVAVEALATPQTVATVARVSSSSPTLAHKNSLVASLHPLAATPFTHSQHLALLARSLLCRLRT
jgi:hypothetical protein